MYVLGTGPGSSKINTSLRLSRMQAIYNNPYIKNHLAPSETFQNNKRKISMKSLTHFYQPKHMKLNFLYWFIIGSIARHKLVLQNVSKKAVFTPRTFHADSEKLFDFLQSLANSREKKYIRFYGRWLHWTINNRSPKKNKAGSRSALPVITNKNSN